MYFIWFFLLFFGILILKEPALLAYIIAWIFILSGIKTLLLAYHISQAKKSNSQKEGKIFSFGDYEIIKKQK